MLFTEQMSEQTHFCCIARSFIFFSLELTFSERVSCFILQALAFIPPVRDFFLREENYQNIKRPPGDIMFPLGKQF